MRIGLLAGAIGLALFGTAAPVWAHHSYMAEFDQRRPITLTGVIAKVEWMNPHTFFYVDVTEKTGKVVTWTLETGTPSQLIMRGWAQDTLKRGDRVIVTGFRARNGSNLAATNTVKLVDGRELLTGRTDGVDYDSQNKRSAPLRK